MGKEIYKAVQNLPEELVTPDIATAAIAEGRLELLDFLPHKYLTGEVVIGIIERNENSYSWNAFKLSNLPEGIRTQKVCEFAVGKSVANITAVPASLRSTTMLAEMTSGVKGNLKYLHLFPSEAWTQEIVYTGIRSIYSETHSNYGSRGGYHGSTTHTDIKRVQVLLSFVPQRLKDKTFYLNLFQTNLKQEDINLITPDRYKTKAYYLKIAAKEFKLVPEQFYDYDIFMVAIENRQLLLHLPYFSTYGLSVIQKQVVTENHRLLIDSVFAVMDDAMADKVVEAIPFTFQQLPKKFQTPERLIFALEKCERNTISIDPEADYQLFTKDVCKAYVRKNHDLPKLPLSIWTPDFVDYCMAQGTSFRWFEQLPQNLQTQDMVYKVLDYSSSYLSKVRPELVSLEQAMVLFRKDKYNREHIPQYFIKDFKDETGLDERFFGGEVSFATLREIRGCYTYSKLGNTYIGIYRSDRSYNEPMTLVVTRRTPRAFRPVEIFEREIGTFHTTWLEKMIADYDASFVKPTVSKALKPYQYNGYYTVEKVDTYNDVAIYASVLFGEQVYFSTMIDGELACCNSLEKAKEALKEFYSEKVDFGTPVLDAEIRVAI